LMSIVLDSTNNAFQFRRVQKSWWRPHVHLRERSVARLVMLKALEQKIWWLAVPWLVFVSTARWRPAPQAQSGAQVDAGQRADYRGCWGDRFRRPEPSRAMVPARIWRHAVNIARARSSHKRSRRLRPPRLRSDRSRVRRARNYLWRGSLAAAGSRGGALHGGMSCFIYWSWAQESASRSSRFSMQICEWNWALHGGRASSATSSARYSCWPLPQCPTSPGCRQP
jgi:hypothetical protein